MQAMLGYLDRRLPVVRYAVPALLLAVVTALLAVPAPAAAVPTWLAPAEVSPAAGSTRFPQVAVDAAGDATAVWQSSEPGGSTIVAARRPPGGPWEAPMPISSPGRESFVPSVGLDAAGDATAIWGTEEGGSTIVQVTSRSATGAWEAPRTIGSEGEAVEELPQIAVDATGDAVAVWEHETPGHEVVEWASRPAGGTWSAAAPISHAGEAATEPRLAVNAAGDAAAVWTDVGAEETVAAVSRPAGGAWSAPTVVTAAGEEGALPKVGLDAAGDATVIWERIDAAHFVIREADRAAAGPWSTPRRLSPSGVDSVAPELAVDPGDDAVAVWDLRISPSDTAVGAASRPGSGAWGEPEQVAPADTSGQVAKVGIDAAGDATVVWRDGPLPNTDIDAARRPAAGDWTPPVAISTPGEETEEAQVVVDPAGDALTVWERFEGGDSVVQSAAFDAVGPSLGSLSIPASGTAGVSLTFAVAPLDAISPVAATTWSFGDGGSAATATAGHTYAAPGTYPVTVTSVDGAGNASSASGQVTIAPAPVTAPAPVRTPPPGRAAAGRLVKVKGGKALLSLSCPAGGGACAGTAKLSAAPAAKPKRRVRARPGPRRLTLGAAGFSVAAGARRTVAVKLTKKGLALVRGAAPAGLAARLEGSGLGPQAVLLKQAPAHRRHRSPAGSKRGGS